MSQALASHEAYRHAVEFLNGLQVFGARFGLENTLKLAALVGNPQRQLRFIHVAGTNGKGSTCAMLESIYRAAGLRVGLFTSPHLVSFRERIQVNRELISEAKVVRLVAEVAAGILPAVEPGILPGGKNLDSAGRLESSKSATSSSANPGGRMPDATTFFEFVTVMALKYFAEQKCELVIWETGLGGRLDATNIVTPLASVITNIGLDHQQWLGDTLEKIATEKAGIIKPGVTVVTATTGEALAVIERIAREQDAPLVKVGQAGRLSGAGVPPALPLPGKHQRLNAALALATVEALQNKIHVSEQQRRTGLAQVNWPGRMQLITRPSGQKILLDGAHNSDGAEVLRAALQAGAPASGPACFSKPTGRAGPETGAPSALILGILGDKNCRAMCHILAPLAARILLVPVKSERTAKPAELAEFCRTENPRAIVVVCASLREALEKSASEPFVVIAGSLYLIGEAMELLHLTPAPERDEKSLNEWTPSVPASKRE